MNDNTFWEIDIGDEECITRLQTVNPYPTAFPYGNGMVAHDCNA